VSKCGGGVVECVDYHDISQLKASGRTVSWLLFRGFPDWLKLGGQVNRSDQRRTYEDFFEWGEEGNTLGG